MKIKQKPHLHASWIDPDALQIVRTLQKAGFTTYLVGGCVRDLLTGIHPKDFDIATNAEPNQVKKKVHNSYIIGRRFRLVLVRRGSNQFEVATFRRESTPEDFEGLAEDEKPSGDNFFGTPEQDAIRRDFTINALFYDSVKDELIDFVNGLADIDARIIRMIGDPTQRILEDSIRSLRAIRLAHKLNFVIEDSLRQAMQENGEALGKSILPRRREEYLKILRLPNPSLVFVELFDLGLLSYIFPTLHQIFQDPRRLEIFSEELELIHKIVENPTLPSHMYTAFLAAFRKSAEGLNNLEELEDALMKNELGMFKNEISFVQGVFDFQKNLLEPDIFLRRGSRRQRAFIDNEFFPLALSLSIEDRSMTTSNSWFWREYLSYREAPTDSESDSEP